MEKRYPKTLLEAVRYFSDLDVAHDFFSKARWPDGVIACPHCGATGAKFLVKYRRWECKNKHPKRQFTVKVGTVMEDSPLGLDKWAVGMWLEVNAKNSISSYEVHRALGITQKSAWFMQHRIRFALHQGSFEKQMMSGVVEADESFIGGAARNMHAEKRRRVIKNRGPSGSKTPVMGLLQRHSEKGKSRVATAVIANTKRTTLHPLIRENVAP